jgi:NAD(P)H-hydrate epimerase
MPPFLSREQVRALDRRAIEEYGVPGVVLMENAGRGAAEVLLRLGVQGPVVVCCGKGNNGGDGFVIARHLDNRGVAVRVVYFGKPQDLAGEAAVNFEIVRRSGLPLTVIPAPGPVLDLDDAEWVVDALLGTGATGPARPPLEQVIAAINNSKAKVLAVDLPSGLDCDTGLPLGPCVRALHTVTFVAQKTGFAKPAAREWTGQIHVVDIGAPRALVQALLSPAAAG